MPDNTGPASPIDKAVFNIYKNLDRFVDRIANQVEINHASHARTVTIEQPNSVMGLLATSAPHLLIQLFFSLLVIFFFLAGWTAMRDLPTPPEHTFRDWWKDR